MTQPGILNKLSEGQLVCLRLVLEHKSSKDIARELGISRHTVDQRLKGAMRLLGATSRVAAARKLRALEDPHGYQSLIHQSSDIEATADVGNQTSSVRDGWRPADAVCEEQVPYGGPSPLPRLPIEPDGGVRNRLGVWQRIGSIILVAVTSMIAFGAFLAGLHALVGIATESGRLF